jgi:LysM repeat protein
MKLLKIFGIVAGIHVVALILIFANPGCSTTSKPQAAVADTVIAPDASPVVSMPPVNGSQPPAADDTASTQFNAGGSPATPAPISFNPAAAAASAADGRYSPTRPGTSVASALQTEPVSNVVPVTAYTVARGDSLWSIAKHNHISVAELAGANNLRSSSTLHLGQKIVIPGKATGTGTAAAAPAKTAPEPAAAKTAGASKSTTESITHVVKSGETLGGIARKYQVSVGEIATANNITDPAKIRPGQSLIIPGWKAPAAKSAAKPAAQPAVTTPSPMDTPAPKITDGAPIFVAPPADKPLDQGLKSSAGDAPVIQVQDANTSNSSN